MSSIRWDVSGARGVSLQINDPALTAAQVSTKQGDDVAISIGGTREVSFVLPPSAKIQKRRRTVSRERLVDGRLVRDDQGNIVRDPVEEEFLVFVMPGAIGSIFGRVSATPDERAGDTGPKFESHPHVSVSARRYKDDEWHHNEVGELVEETTVGDLNLFAE